MIFISYPWKKQKENAIYLYERLVEQFGSDQVFIDEQQIKPGDDLWRTIYNAMDKTNYFIYINSEEYRSSANCLLEYIKATELERMGKLKIIEMNIDGSQYSLNNKKLFVRVDDFKETTNKLIDSICKKNFSEFEIQKSFEILKIENKSNELGNKELSITLKINYGMGNPTFGALYSYNSEKIQFNTHVLGHGVSIINDGIDNKLIANNCYCCYKSVQCFVDTSSIVIININDIDQKNNYVELFVTNPLKRNHENIGSLDSMDTQILKI